MENVIYQQENLDTSKMLLMNILLERLLETKTRDQGIELRRPTKESHFVKVPRVEILIKAHWQNFSLTEISTAHSLRIEISCNIPNDENDLIELEGCQISDIVLLSGTPIMHFQTKFFEWVMTLPQLRLDILKLYNINPRKYHEISEDEDNNNANSNLNSEGSGLGIGLKKVIVYSDYLDLIQFTLNDQLNIKNKFNIFQLISDVQIKFNATSLRLLCTNINTPYNTQIGETELSIYGVQSVVDSVIFSCSLKKKEVSVTAKMLKKKKSASQNLIWQMKNGYGQVNNTYVSFFDGENLMPSNPEEFILKKKANFDKSMNNPKIFNEFFGLIPIRGKDLNNNSSKIKEGALHLVHEEEIFSWCSEEIKLKSPPSGHQLKKKSTSNIFAEENKNSNITFKIIHDSSPSLTKSPQVSELKLSAWGIFLKADTIIYEQNKNLASINTPKILYPHGGSKISHFLRFTQSKFLLNQNLKPVVKNLVYELVINKGLRKLAEHSNSSSDHNSTNKRDARDLKDEHQEYETFDNLNFHDDILHEIGILKNFKSQNTTFIKILIAVEKPQINIYDQDLNIQMLLGSPDACWISLGQSFLQYDRFRQDPKNMINVVFETLECYISPTNIDIQNNVYWLDDAKENFIFSFNTEEAEASPDTIQGTKPAEGEQPVFQTSGLLKKAVICDITTFSYEFFYLDECEIDFSLPLNLEKLTKATPEKIQLFSKLSKKRSHLWKDDFRSTSLKIEVGNLRSYMDSNSFDLCKNIVSFFAKLVHSEEVTMTMSKLKKNTGFFEEIKQYGKDSVAKYIEESISKEKNNSYGSDKRLKASFQFGLKSVTFYMTKNDSAFIKFSILGLHGKYNYYSDTACDLDFKIKRVDADNLSEEMVNSVPEKIIECMFKESSNKIMLAISFSTHLVAGRNPNVRWRVFDNYELNLQPVSIRISKEVFHFFYEYIFHVEPATSLASIYLMPGTNISYPNSAYTMKKVRSMTNQQQRNILKSELKSTKNKNDMKKMGKAAPMFFKRVRIGDVKVYVTFRSGSILTRFENMKLFLESFERLDNFTTYKTIFDKYVKYGLRKGLSSVIKYKLFGSSHLASEADEEEDNKNENLGKKKLLFGSINQSQQLYSFLYF